MAKLKVKIICATDVNVLLINPIIVHNALPTVYIISDTTPVHDVFIDTKTHSPATAPRQLTSKRHLFDFSNTNSSVSLQPLPFQENCQR